MNDANTAATTEYNNAKKLEAHNQYVQAVRDRTDAIGIVKPRASDDLREEERDTVYRAAVGRLMQHDYKYSASGNAATDKHVVSELIRAYFDVNSLLYFVAQDWWSPSPTRNIDNPGSFTEFGTTPLDPPSDTITWGGAGRDNYLITEESRPAALGASLGWTIQLDGDDFRNAFLNSPWVKVVIPILPGREMEAIAWLQNASVEGADGLNAIYQDPSGGGQQTVLQALEELAQTIKSMNTSMDNYLQTETVFENGFDPLAKGFIDGAASFQVCSQWTEVLPTDQVVALSYDPADHL